MSAPALGKKVPNVDILITGNVQTSLKAYAGKPLVLYFYPKASTPGVPLKVSISLLQLRNFVAKAARF